MNPAWPDQAVEIEAAALNGWTVNEIREPLARQPVEDGKKMQLPSPAGNRCTCKIERYTFNYWIRVDPSSESPGVVLDNPGNPWHGRYSVGLHQREIHKRPP